MESASSNVITHGDVSNDILDLITRKFNRYDTDIKLLSDAIGMARTPELLAGFIKTSVSNEVTFRNKNIFRYVDGKINKIQQAINRGKSLSLPDMDKYVLKSDLRKLVLSIQTERQQQAIRNKRKTSSRK